MKLEAKERLELTAGPAKFKPDVLLQMHPAQLHQLAKGLSEIYSWFSGSYTNKDAEGKLVMSGPQPTPDLTLMINTMFWLSKYFAPKTLGMFRRVWRLHDMQDDYKSAQIGQVVKIDPFKPILSWSDKYTGLDDIRNFKDTDVILELDNPRVVFSYKTIRFINSDVARKLESKVIKLKGKIPDDQWKALDAVCEEFGSLSRQVREYQNEQEVIVYNPKPFKAKIFQKPREAAQEKVRSVIQPILDKLNVDPSKVQWQGNTAIINGGPAFQNYKSAAESSQYQFLKQKFGQSYTSNYDRFVWKPEPFTNMSWYYRRKKLLINYYG